MRQTTQAPRVGQTVPGKRDKRDDCGWTRLTASGSRALTEADSSSSPAATSGATHLVLRHAQLQLAIKTALTPTRSTYKRAARPGRLALPAEHLRPLS